MIFKEDKQMNDYVRYSGDSFYKKILLFSAPFYVTLVSIL